MNTKRIIAAVVVCALCTVRLSSQSVDLPVIDKTYDITPLVKNLMPATVLGWNGSGDPLKLAGAFYQLPWNFHDSSGTSFVEPTPGFVWSADGDQKGQGGPVMAIGLRADNIYSRVLANQWMRDHYLTPKCPYVKVGPMIGYINRLGWVYGGFVAIGLGSN